MKSIQVGEFKARFSELLNAVKAGETVVISYGRKREKVAALVPYRQVAAPARRKLGVLEKRARVRFAKDFAISDDEMLRV
jgi:prevent-host-death family protein